MRNPPEPKSVSTDTSGGKLNAWGEAEDDEMYGYVESTETLFTRTKFIGLDAGGDKEWKLPMRKSLFAHVPPYVIFRLHDAKKPCELPPQIVKHLSWRRNGRLVPKMVRKTVAKSGFSFAVKNGDWCGNWGPPMSAVQFRALKSFQKVNHIPGTLELSRKDRLWRSVNRMMRRFGKSEFNFTPTSYVFPEDARRFKKLFDKRGGIWITKPPAGCGGHGIRVVSKWCEIPKRYPLVVQQYIARPRLIQGVKFDMRLYALITSFNPLRVYLYTEGLVRFATAKYIGSVQYLFDRYMHLTNTSVNKNSPMFRPNDSLDKCKGNMWSLNSLWSYLAKQRVNVPRLWERIKDIVIKTIISAEAAITAEISNSKLPSSYNAYQLLGFDVMLDENLKPWLLEVNNFPSMDPDTPLCAIVKGQLARDFLNIVGYQIPDILPPEETKYLMKKYGQYDPLCLDKRLHAKTLTPDENEKQNKFSKVRARGDYLDPIIEVLTPDDVRHLIKYEDEVTQVGGFEKIFPTKITHAYHRFFDEVRYYDKLFDGWEEAYGSGGKKTEGITRLKILCNKKFHV